jgi:hypothetical protein
LRISPIYGCGQGNNNGLTLGTLIFWLSFPMSGQEIGSRDQREQGHMLTDGKRSESDRWHRKENRAASICWRSHSQSSTGESSKSHCRRIHSSGNNTHKHPRSTTMARLHRMTSLALVLSLAVLSSLLSKTLAQVGVNLCACQPSVYTFTLDFSATCEDANIEGPGIFDKDCTVSGVGRENVTDKVPVQVSSIQILELDQNLQVITQTPVVGTFLDGETFTYTSIIATESDNLNTSMVPRGFQMVLTGVNSLDEFIRNTWIIVYENDCGIFPILFEGQQNGWTIFVSSAGGALVLYDYHCYYYYCCCYYCCCC